jgi:hypothetical protein
MNSKQPQPPLPKTATMPMPTKPVPERAYNMPERGHNSFLTSAMHEDVGRVMQNIIDLQTEVAQLRKERQEWERRALLAEGKVEQLKQEIADTRDDHYKDVAQLKAISAEDIARVQHQLDYYKSRDAIVQTKLNIGAQHFLDCISAVEKDRKDQENKVLSAMEAELTEAPMPSVVTQGPRTE